MLATLGLGVLLLRPPAAAAVVPAPPTTPPQIAALRFFIGKWRCSGTVFATAQAPAHTVIMTLSCKPDLMNFWFMARWLEIRSPEHPVSRETVDLVGWDPVRGTYVAYRVDNHGSSAVLTSAGWRGEAWTWEGDGAVEGGAGGFRTVLTRVNPKLLVIRTFVRRGQGAWTPVAAFHADKIF